MTVPPAQTVSADFVPVSFGERLLSSEQFRTLFREGMGLVEEAAGYLDGEGRHASKDLPTKIAMFYTTESMKLTTRLMQMASWLLIYRATSEGEITVEQARMESRKVSLSSTAHVLAPELLETLPETLRSLISRTKRLQERLQLLEQQFQGPYASPQTNVVASQLVRVKTAFTASSKS